MAKKTRKQKQRTEARKLKTAQSFKFVATPVKDTSQIKTLKLDTHIRNDLAKTVILGSLFIGFEFLLAIFANKLGW